MKAKALNTDGADNADWRGFFICENPRHPCNPCSKKLAALVVETATLRAFARIKRSQLLRAIQALLPVIAEQGGVPALRETVRAIVDTAKWWP